MLLAHRDQTDQCAMKDTSFFIFLILKDVFFRPFVIAFV